MVDTRESDVTSEAASERMPLGLKVGWAFGSVGTILVIQTYQQVLLFYLTTVVGVAAATAGTLLLVGKLLDAGFAPAVGSASDRADTRWGRRRPFLFAGAIVAAVGVATVFHPTELGNGALPLVAVGLAVLALGYSLFNVPYITMPVEMTDSPQERTSLISWRIAFISAGGIFAGFLPKLAESLGGGLDGYGEMGLILGVVIATAMLIACFASGRARQTQRAVKPAGGNWAAVFESRDFMLLLVAKVFQLIGLASTLASILFLWKIVMKADLALLGYYGAFASGATILSMPMWTRVSRGRSKRGLYVLGCLGFSAVALTWTLAGPGEPFALTCVRAVAGGLFSGLLLLMGQSLLPDVIDADCKRTGERREGAYAAAYSVVEKVSTAVGPFLIGAILAWFGFKPGPNVVQSAGVETGVIIGAAILPALFYALSVIPLLAMYRGTRAVPVTA